MKKVLITLTLAFATASAIAQTVQSLQIDSVVAGPNPMTQKIVYFSYVNLSEIVFSQVHYGETPNPNINVTHTSATQIAAGTGTSSAMVSGLNPNQQYAFLVRLFLGATPYNSVITYATTSACNFQAGITTNGNDTICQGQSVNLTASPTGASYTWYRNGLPLSGEVNQTLTVNQSGTYMVSVNNGCVATASTAVTVVNANATVTANGPTTFCVGGSVGLTANAGASYLWSNGATTQTVTASVVGDYSVIVTTSNSCLATSNVVSVSTLTAGAMITTGGPTTFCYGGSVELYSSSGVGNLWSNGATTQSITVDQSGDYYVVVNSGCSGTSPSVTVTENPAPITPVITASGPLNFCTGGSVLLSTAITNTSYTWNNGAISGSILVNQQGNYSVTVTDTNGCQSPESSVVTVMVNPMPTPEISANGPTTFCAGGSVQLSAFGEGTYYNWNNGSLGTAQTVTASASGTYTVDVINQYGCSASASQSITVNPLPTPQVTANGSTTFCEGESVILTTNAPGSYTWSTGHTDQSISVNTTGTYSVTVINSSGCENTSNNLVITTNASPEVGIVQYGPNGSSITANVFGGTAPYEYLWSTSSTTPSITVFQNGQYQVTVTDANGCSGSNLTSVIGVGIEEMMEQIGGVNIAYVRVMDLSGREIANLRNKNELMQLSSGVYVVTCHNHSGEIIYSAKMHR